MAKAERVFVLDGDTSYSLHTAKSLNSAGYEVEVGFTYGTRMLYTYLSSCKGRAVLYPDPLFAPEDFLNFVTSVSSRYKWIIPSMEKTQLCISRIKSRLEESGVFLPIPTHDTLVRATNKVEMLNLAHENRIPIPPTLILSEAPQIDDIENEVGYPFIMKVSSEINIAPGPGERYFVVRKKTQQSNIDEMFTKLARDGPVIFQRYINGIGLGAAYIFNRYGELISYFGHKRILEAFVDEGPSLVAETYIHPRALKYGADLLRTLDWKGPAMVEFRMTPTGCLFFMELNPRFWGTLSLATVSGLDFPKLLLQNYNVRPSNPYFRYKRKVWLRLGTLDLLSDSLRKRNYRLARKVLSSTFKSFKYGPPTIADSQELDLATITRSLVARLALAMDKDRVSDIGNIMFGPALSNERLSKLGVRHIVDLREDQEKSNDNPPSEDCRVQFHELPLTDDTAPSIETFTSAISLIDDLLKEGKVYIHCRLGTGRAPTIVVGWLLSHGFSLDEAFALLYSKRPYSSLNMVQKRSVYLLYKYFRDDVRSGVTQS